MPLPDFTSPLTFPRFLALPQLTTTTTTPSRPNPEPNPEPEPEPQEYYLLAQITQNMTLTKPTLLLTDQPQEKTTATPFALVFSSRSASGPDTLDLAKLGYKRGSTLVIPHARRTLPPLKPQLKPEDTPEPEDKPRPGFIAVDRQIEGDVRVVPGSLAKVVEVGCWLRGRDDRRMEREAEDEDEDEEKGGRGCESCGAGMKKDERGKGGGLMRCTGCGEVEYCSKACQARGWNEGGHKEDCKVIKAIRTIWP